MFCPSCDEEITPIKVTERNTYPYKGEQVEVEDKLQRCPKCGAEWSQEDFDFAAEVYRVYDLLYGKEMQLSPLVLTPESAVKVIDLLEKPRPPTPALKALFSDDD